MTMLASYHLLIRSLAPAGPAPRLFADAVRRTVCGFVGALDYSRRATLLIAAAPGEAALAERLRILMASDANPVPALVACARTPQAFEACWNGLHRCWHVGIDTIVSLRGNELAFERRARCGPGIEPEADSELKQRVIAQCLGLLRRQAAPGTTLAAVGDRLGIERSAGAELARWLPGAPEAPLAAAAAALGCSPRTLERQLCAEGLRFAELRSATRLIEAGRLLRETALPITELALAAGFYDGAHFARGFRRSTGLTAGQYRQLARRTLSPPPA